MSLHETRSQSDLPAAPLRRAILAVCVFAAAVAGATLLQQQYGEPPAAGQSAVLN